MSVTLHPFTKDNFKDAFALQISDEEMNHAQLGTMPEILAEVANNEERVGLVIYSDETAVGFTDYTHFPPDKECHIYHFLVDESQRNKGKEII